MDRLALILGSLAPCVILLLLCTLLLRKQNPPAKPREIVMCFLLGLVSAVLSVAMIWLIFQSLAPRITGRPLAYGLYEAFFLAAIPEELARFLVLRWWLGRRSGELTGRRCLLFGAVVGLGFAAIENVGFARHGWGTVLERSVTALPFHMLAGAIVGYFTGLSMHTRRIRWAALGVLITTVLHGINNFNWAYYFDSGPLYPLENVTELPTEGLAGLLITGWPSNILCLALSIGIVIVLARRRGEFGSTSEAGQQ